MDTRAFIVPLHDLDEAGRTFEFDIPVAWLRSALEGCEMQPAGPDGHVQAHVSKTGTDVIVHGKVDVELVIPCARCLSEFQFHPPAELSLVLEPARSEPTIPGNVRKLAPEARGHHSGAGRSSGGHGSEPARSGARSTAAAHSGSTRPASARTASEPAGRKGGAKGHGAGHKGDDWTAVPELPQEDVDQDTYDGEEVALDRWVREAILLESPIFPLCSETCEGIRPGQVMESSGTPGGEPDPRLARLIEFGELAKKRTTKE